jgi:hypothetical protein
MVRLAGVPLVQQLHVNPDDLLVVPDGLAELVRHLIPVMIRHLDVSAFHNDVHA